MNVVHASLQYSPVYNVLGNHNVPKEWLIWEGLQALVYYLHLLYREANYTVLPKINRLASASQQLTTNILTKLTEPKQVTYQTEPSCAKHKRANDVIKGQLGLSNTNIILCRKKEAFHAE